MGGAWLSANPGGTPWTVDQTDAAIAEVAYESAGGAGPTTNPADDPNLIHDIAQLQQWITLNAGPWSLTLSAMTPATARASTPVRTTPARHCQSADGTPENGFQLTAPAVGGGGEVTNFVWNSPTTPGDTLHVERQQHRRLLGARHQPGGRGSQGLALRPTCHPQGQAASLG